MVTTESSQFLPDLRHGPELGDLGGEVGGLFVTLLGLWLGLLEGERGQESLEEPLSRLQVRFLMVSEAPTL